MPLLCFPGWNVTDGQLEKDGVQVLPALTSSGQTGNHEAENFTKLSQAGVAALASVNLISEKRPHIKFSLALPVQITPYPLDCGYLSFWNTEQIDGRGHIIKNYRSPFIQPTAKPNRIPPCLTWHIESKRKQYRYTPLTNYAIARGILFIGVVPLNGSLIPNRINLDIVQTRLHDSRS